MKLYAKIVLWKLSIPNATQLNSKQLYLTLVFPIYERFSAKFAAPRSYPQLRHFNFVSSNVVH